MKKRALLFLLLVSPLFYLGGNLFLGFWSLKTIQADLKKNNFATFKKKSLMARDSFRRSRDFLKLIPLEKIEDPLTSLEFFSEGLLLTFSAAEETQKLAWLFLQGEEVKLDESLPKIKRELEAAFAKTSMAQSLTNHFTGTEAFYGPWVLKLKEWLPGWRSFLWQAQEVTTILPEILGTEKRQAYLFLWQNNMELRPTGGFIGSYGILTLEKGRLLDFEIQDVYFADGQLRGHVEPPAKLREFLGQASWFLRDSNWDPDFPASAARAEWFLEKETGRQVDGVIGVNLFVLKRILAVFGEIDIPQYQEKINANNFFERVQFRAEVGFFPGSRAKQDFLGAVALGLFEKLQKASQEEQVKVALAFYQSLLEKDLLIFLHKEEAARVMSKFNWDGALRQAQCPAKQDPALPDKGRNEGCLEDYLMIVEANMGVNKANYYLERNLELKTKIDSEGKIKKDLMIIYQNKSPAEIFPAGKYKNYLRLFLPEGSARGDCRINNEECRIEETTEHQRKVFGFLVEVPVGEKRQVEFSWSLPENFEGGRYRFLVQKQSGSRNDPFVFSYSYPENWKIISQTPGFLTGRGFLFYNTILSQDKMFNLEFKKLDQ